MKVYFSEASKRIITLEEAPIAKAIINDLKEDCSTVDEYAKIAIETACKQRCVEVFKAKASIAKNQRIDNVFSENSKDIDVWIEATAQIDNGFCIIGVYLSDIWQLNDENSDYIAKNHMYIQIFTEKAA